MAEFSLEDAFNDCIDRLNAGQSIDACVQAYPHYANELRPLLETGVQASNALPPSGEVIAAQDRMRSRVLDALEAPAPPSRIVPFSRIFYRIAAVAAAVMLLFGVTGIMAESALPGDTLYGVKRFTEDVRVTFGGESVREQFAARRYDEINTLLQAGRAAEVDFAGGVEAIDGENWRINGVDVRVPAAVMGTQIIQVGDRVEMRANITTQREIIVTSIEPVGQNAQQIEPNISPTPTTTVSPTSTVTMTPTSTVTMTPTSTVTMTPTSTVTMTPTSTPTRTPSQTGASDDDNIETAVSMEEAAATALEVYPNATVDEIELDTLNGGTLVWVVELSNNIEIVVDAATGIRLQINVPGQSNDNGNDSSDDDDSSDDADSSDGDDSSDDDDDDDSSDDDDDD